MTSVIYALKMDLWMLHIISKRKNFLRENMHYRCVKFRNITVRTIFSVKLYDIFLNSLDIQEISVDVRALVLVQRNGRQVKKHKADATISSHKLEEMTISFSCRVSIWFQTF